MDRIPELSCEMVGRDREPDTPSSVTPDLILPEITFACSVELMETVPPEV